MILITPKFVCIYVLPTLYVCLCKKKKKKTVVIVGEKDSFRGLFFPQLLPAFLSN